MNRPFNSSSIAAKRARMLTVILALPIASLAGCGTGRAPGVGVKAHFNGSVHGGQQPVSGSHVYLFAASTLGNGASSTSLLNTSASGVSTDSAGNGYVTSDAGGGFTITGDYTCPANALVYAAAVAGNPGLGAGNWNAAITLVTALGACSSLSPSTFIAINELTTVASVWALAPFTYDLTDLGADVNNTQGLSQAFAAVTELVDTSTGALPGPSLPAHAVLPIAQMNTIADILASCINSQGGVAGDGTTCGNLFTAATPSGTTSPNDTFTAALRLAQNPSLSPASLFALVPSFAPFQPTLSAPPTDWTLAIQYKPAGLSTPKALAIDAGGNVWIANCGSANCATTGVGSVTKLANSGALLGTTSAGGLNIPYALAIDLNGNAWIANNGGNSVTELNPALDPVAAAYTGSSLSQPNSIAIDTYGDAWLTNTNSDLLSEFSSAGVAQTPTTVPGVTAPVALAINPH